MIKSLCSRPDFFNGLLHSDNNLHIFQTYSPTPDIDNYFSSLTGKIVVIVYLGEYHGYTWVEELLSRSKNYFVKTGKLKNYYIFLSVHQYSKSLFSNYSNFFTLIHEPTLYSYYTDHFQRNNYLKNIKYHFLSLNNRASVSRQALYYFFTKFSLVEKSYFSYHGDLSRTNYQTTDEITNEIIDGGIPWFTKNLDYSKLNTQIPVKLLNDNFFDNDWSIGQLKYYQETFCSVVLETYDSQEFPFLTEKTWKPIAFGHPFIIHANPNTLTQLQDLGFKTFNDFWDEDYDKLSGNHRLEAIFHLLLEIGNWSIDRLNLVCEKLLPMLEYNQQHFFNVLPNMHKAIESNTADLIKSIAKEKTSLL